MRFDHVLLGVGDLDLGIESFRDLTGVEPRRGGRHPDMGTRNALASLGDREYLEIIAPEPGARLAPMFRELSALEELTPVMWVLAVEDADDTAARLRSEGHTVVGPTPGSRVRPGGEVLEWRVVTTPERRGRVPFFIEWGADTPHPSTTEPGGCSLVSMEIVDPRPEGLRGLVEPLEPRVRLRAGARPSLAFELAAPRGPVRFAG